MTREHTAMPYNSMHIYIMACAQCEYQACACAQYTYQACTRTWMLYMDAVHGSCACAQAAHVLRDDRPSGRPSSFGNGCARRLQRHDRPCCNLQRARWLGQGTNAGPFLLQLTSAPPPPQLLLLLAWPLPSHRLLRTHGLPHSCCFFFAVASSSLALP